MFLTAFLALVILLLLLMIVLLSIYPVRMSAVFSSEQQPDIRVTMSWLGSFVRGYITRQGGAVNLTIDMLNIRVYRKSINPQAGGGIGLKITNYREYIRRARFLEVKNAKLSASYGFLDLSVTGMLCGVINFIPQYISLDEFHNNPDFFAYNNYFYVDAKAEINAVLSAIGILRKDKHHISSPALGRNR